jgi:hypothetical protein
MLTLKFVLDGIRAMSPGQNQARQDYQRDSKNHDLVRLNDTTARTR